MNKEKKMESFLKRLVDSLDDNQIRNILDGNATLKYFDINNSTPDYKKISDYILNNKFQDELEVKDFISKNIKLKKDIIEFGSYINLNIDKKMLKKDILEMVAKEYYKKNNETQLLYKEIKKISQINNVNEAREFINSNNHFKNKENALNIANYYDVNVNKSMSRDEIIERVLYSVIGSKEISKNIYDSIVNK